MLRILGIRITSTVFYSFSLVAVALVVLYITISSTGSVKKRSWWSSWPADDPDTSYLTSPYNAANKKKKVAEKPPPGTQPKLISWQAQTTLKVMAATSDMFKECLGVRTCKVSPSKSIISQAAAVVFDSAKMAKQTPPRLDKDRILIYYSMRIPADEPPQGKGRLFTQYWSGVFNWIWSFRLDTDIFQPFGYIRKIVPPQGRVDDMVAVTNKKSKMVLFINPQISKSQSGAAAELANINLHKGKSSSGIEAYLRAFEKVMPYDTMGLGELLDSLKPGPDGKQSDFKLTDYFFVLAFESGDCQDYVSDLFFSVFDPRILAMPVVRGGFNYTRHLPKFTFIDANEYETPRKLVAHLKKLASNAKTYNNMLWRKTQYRREDSLPSAWCQLCDMLHQADSNRNLKARIDSIHAWFREGGQCFSDGGGDDEHEEEEEEGEGEGGDYEDEEA